jgi:hypothetical protein
LCAMLAGNASLYRFTTGTRHRDLPRMSGAGTGNFRSECLRVLTHAFTDDRALLAMEACETMGAYFANADLPAWHYKVAVESRMLGVIKSISPEGPDIRPVNVGDMRTRTLTPSHNRFCWGLYARVPDLCCHPRAIR